MTSSLHSASVVNASAPVRIEGTRIYLREIVHDDVDQMLRILGDPRFTNTLHFEPKTRQETHDYVNQLIEEAQQAPRKVYSLGVILRSTDELFGCITLKHDGCLAGSISGGGRPDTWSQGYGTEGTKLIVDFGFRELGLHRIFSMHVPDNPAVGTMLRKAGLTYEGCLRHHRFSKGKWFDSMVYSVLEHEWSANKIS